MADKPSLTLKRRLNAPATKVYGAWTQPSEMMRWWGPQQAETLHAETDPRVGGRYHVTFRTPDGEQHDVSGTYRTVIPNEKLVFTWAWRTTPERESLVTVDLQSDGDATLLTLTHEQLFNEAVRDDHRRGWTGSLDRLQGYLA